MKAMADGKGKDTEERGKAVRAARGERQPLPYWCGVCERAVPEKRCPYCGLKAKRIR